MYNKLLAVAATSNIPFVRLYFPDFGDIWYEFSDRVSFQWIFYVDF